MKSTTTLEVVKKVAKDIGFIIRKKQYEVLRDAMAVYVNYLYNNLNENDKKLLEFTLKKYEQYGIKLNAKNSQ